MPTTPVIPKTPTIKVDGSALAEQVYNRLIDVRVEHAISTTSRATLRISDPDFSLVDGTTFAVAKTITIEFPDSSDTATQVFDGEIVSIGVEQPVGGSVEGFEVTVIALDRSHKLTHGGVAASYQQSSYSDVLMKVAQQAGLSADVTNSGVTHDYLVTTGSYYDAVDSICRVLGFEWRVEGSKLIAGPRPTSPTSIPLEYGKDLRRLRVRFTAADRTTTVTVRSWDPKTKRAIVSTSNVSNTAPEAVSGTAPLGSDGRTKSRGGATARVVHAVPFASSDEGAKVATGLGLRIGSSDLYLRGECIGNPAIKLGTMVEIKKAGTRVSGKYYVTSIEHVFGRQTDFVTRFASGGAEPSTLVDLLGNRGPAAPRFGEHGLCVGIVTNNKDPEDLGRVRVKFPALDEQLESGWARVVYVGAGKERGLFVLPNVNDEVLVGFEQGDLRRPYVLGGLFNGTDKPPIKADAGNAGALDGSEVKHWRIQNGGKDYLMLKHGNGAEHHAKIALNGDAAILYLGEDKVEVISQSKSVTVKNGAGSIVISDQGDITIKGKTITLEAQQDVTVKGMNVNTKATLGVKVEGVNVEVKAQANAKVEGTAMTEIKGAMVKVN